MTTIIDGKQLSQQIRAEVAEAVKAITTAGQKQPGLAVIIVGDNKASRVYVNSKKKACEEAGIYSREITLDGETTQAGLLEEIRQLNQDPQIHGILLQLPLPSHLDESEALQTIDPHKDVDGFHPINVGYLHLGVDTFVPCTPLGVMEMLKRYNIPLEGKTALVVGRSNIVGKPMAALLTKANATVTVAHSRTRDLPALIGNADILVAGLGKPEFVKGEWVKPGSVVIDVGINSVDDASAPRGYRLVGDVEYEPAAQRAAFITPVPGGVGPMTIAMLLANTLKAKQKFA
ncbi:MAG: bifunctional methylenetetrahydrofolate dehydrogenase/methenyltetrahydrofolate cyclohydrolase FolD [Candidatus Riflebacteria bacterium HGW-Riflebacteria-2]|nr:MAG: bifunctional methylenetetrahydrofolate dehydrogenase/methenyltetrahydrofolate cyclohydrolase FolD [Candidatus Riflebacteria bacterium HGW-Riflebacteria-2]